MPQQVKTKSDLLQPVRETLYNVILIYNCKDCFGGPDNPTLIHAEACYKPKKEKKRNDESVNLISHDSIKMLIFGLQFTVIPLQQSTFY